MKHLQKIYKRHKDDFEGVNRQANAIQAIMNRPQEILKSADVSLEKLQDSIEKSFDGIYYGFGRHKKFPEASKLQLMMDLAKLSGDEKLKNNSLNMLDAMAMRGLYDHIEGGFFRYSVDAAWEIPHFEKMLYNQAELIPLYTRAYLWTKKELYLDIVKETIKMCEERFMKENLFFSASDADTNHKEGEYFTFEMQEIEDALSLNPNGEIIQESFSFGKNGNFETKAHISFSSDVRVEGFYSFKDELLKVRKSKEYPFIDKKINTAWNAMMVEALYKASILDKIYAKKARKHLDALMEFMYDKGELYHQSLLFNKPTQLGLLEDYAFLISALIAAYEVELDEEHLVKAEYFLNKATKKFFIDGVWYLSDDELHIKADMRDKYYTSPLAKMTQNILKLASIKGSFKYEKLATKTLETKNASIQKQLSDVPASSIAYLMQHYKVITIKNIKEILKRDYHLIKNISYPYITLKVDDKTTNYLACTMRSCFAIQKEFLEIKKDIDAYIKLQGF